jgi:hypothetical protein
LIYWHFLPVDGELNRARLETFPCLPANFQITGILGAVNACMVASWPDSRPNPQGRPYKR